MADDADIAAEHEEAHRVEALRMSMRQRLTTGNGTCRLCGDAVESARLQALPKATHCSECASAIEEDRARTTKTGNR